MKDLFAHETNHPFAGRIRPTHFCRTTESSLPRIVPPTTRSGTAYLERLAIIMSVSAVVLHRFSEPFRLTWAVNVWYTIC